MLNAAPALKTGEKIWFFSAKKEILLRLCYGSMQYLAQYTGSSLSSFPLKDGWAGGQPELWALGCGLWAVTTGRSTPVCSVIKIASSLSNKKREKDFACLGCTIIQSLRPDTSPHIICHFFFHFVNKHLGCNFSSRAFKKFQENRQNVSTEQKSLRIV